MMKKYYSKLPLIMGLFFAVGLVLSSCGGEETPEQELDKDKFIGDYIGEVKCAGILATVIDDPALEFNISNAIPADDNTVQVNLPTLMIPLELTGTVSGNTVSMNETTVEDVMITDPLPVTLNITANGNATLAGNSLTATIDLVGKTTSGDPLASDKCTITANKQ